MTPHGLALAWLRAASPASVVPVIGPRTVAQLHESMSGAAAAHRVTSRPAVLESLLGKAGIRRTPIETRGSPSQVSPRTIRSSTGLTGRPWNRAETGVASSPSSGAGARVSKLACRIAP
jgi:hypothetical protein